MYSSTPNVYPAVDSTVFTDDATTGIAILAEIDNNTIIILL